ncbi:2-dehydropantoate 2-reductase [Paenibacillus sp.]|uniref:ketopantoate reductase family protein n=1 Tax=Paenibacillus sp. TaxID=58172 RepID=UPI002811D892|nr:2-dehydropantoate 2-reductase [Paenibacillus sp.]
MNIDIVGGGSLGLLLAGKAACVPGVRVRLIARTRAQAERVARDGVSVLEPDGAERRSRLSCEAFDAAVSESADADWLWFATKQTHWNDALLAYAAGAAKAGARLLLFQNGVGHVERLAAAGAPPERVFVAVTTEGAKKTAADAVAHTGEGTTAIGSAAAAGSEAAAASLMGQALPARDVLRAAGFEADVVPDIERFVRRKLLTNGVINPLTAILRVTNGELAASPHYRSVMRALFDEAYAALTNAAEATDPEAEWRQVLRVCERTAGNHSSMLQDVLGGRETEIDAITGAVLRSAASKGLAAPTHAAMYAMVRGLSSATADADSHSRDS